MAEETEETTEETTPEWVTSIEDPDLKGAVSKFESPESLFDAIGYKAPDWKDGLDDELKQTADRFTSKEDAIRAIANLRKRESQIRVPGKDATDEERSAYLKAIGVPEDPKEYEFPELSEDEMSEDVVANRSKWAERFHNLNIPKESAAALIQAVAEDAAAVREAQAKADEAFVVQQEETLKSEWKADYEKNHELAKRAFEEIAQRVGLNVDDVLNIEGKDGRSLLGRAPVVKMFALLGKEMGESSFGKMLSESELETLDDEVRSIRDQIAEAQSKGDSKLANKLHQKELALLEKKGDQPIVGSRGRAA